MKKSQEFLRSWVEISKSALIYNLKQFKKAVNPRVKLMAVVKANAYGHGLVKTSKIITKAGVKWLGVDSIDEAIDLRKAKVKTPILVLGYVPQFRLAEIISNNIKLTCYNLKTIEKLGKLAPKLKKVAHIHLKIETGTGRQGIGVEAIPEFINTIGECPFVRLEGISSHFANAEVPSSSFTKKQLSIFRQAIKVFEKNKIHVSTKHIACTAAVIAMPETFFDMVRVGIGLYGLWPSRAIKAFAPKREKIIELRTALSWKTKVAQVKAVKKESLIGYGCTEKVARDSKIAVLPVGYADGYGRRLSSIGYVLIRGKKAKVLGRICMNMMMVDVTSIKGVKVEDEVVLLGRQGDEEITAEDLAEKLGTINYEVVSRINPLTPRIYV